MHVSDPPVVIFSALNLTEVHLIRAFLADHGYATRIRGEHRVSLAGEVPMDDARIELLVDPRDVDATQALIRAHREQVVVDWHCEACNASNPGNFEHCWQCQHPMPKTRV